MNIIITADTHLPSPTRTLPTRLLKACEQADKIIHAGDWKTTEVYDTLASFAEVHGVVGNADGEDVRAAFPEKKRLTVNGYKIGIVHGHGEKQTTEKRALAAFPGEEMDVIIFGHSHIPLIRYAGPTLLINPGSPTYKRKLPHYSFATLQITDVLKAEMIFFQELE